MKPIRVSTLIAAAGLLGLAACKDLSPSSLIDDAVVTNDVANTSGDAIATSLETMVLNEETAAMPSAGIAASPATPPNLTFTRTRTCYNGTGGVVAGCNPMSQVRKIVTHVTADGTRSGTNTTTGGSTGTWSGAVHRVHDDTVTRNFNSATPAAEVSRTHSGVGVGHDTTSFTGEDVTRNATETANDSVKAVTWNLPHSSNPWPVSGSLVRAVSVHVTFTKGSLTESRDVTRRVEVIFPADAQGNVVLKVNDKTCNLNLVTHAVTNCH